MYLRMPTVLLVAFTCVLVFVVPSSAVVMGIVALVLVLAAIDAWCAPRPGELQFHREHAASVHLGESTTARLHVANPTARRYRGALRDAWTPGAGPQEEGTTIDLAPAAQLVHDVVLTPTRRGWRPAAEVTVRVRGPLGLAGRQASITVPGAISVLPSFASRRHLASRVVSLREIEGRSLVRSGGQGSEFDSLRDYVRGDDVRSIDWRATARRRSPVVRTWRPERDRSISIVQDTSRLSAGRMGDTTRLDAGMEASLLLTALAGHAGDTVHWCAGERAVRVALPPLHDSDGIARMLTAMAPLEPVLVEPDWAVLLDAATAQLRQRSLVVLVTTFDPSVVTEALLPHLPALVQTHHVVIASVADPSLSEMAADRHDVTHVYDAAAAERTHLQIDDLRDAVERHGVHVLHESPERLAPALADLYVQFKRHGTL